MICAVIRGARLANYRELPNCLTDWIRVCAYSIGGIPWLLVFTVLCSYLIYWFMWSGVIPVWPNAVLTESEIKVFWVVLLSWSAFCGFLFRVVGIEAGFRFSRRQSETRKANKTRHSNPH